MKKKTDKIKVGQRYESRTFFMNPYERGKHIVRILDINDGYALYKYESGSNTLYSTELEDIIKKYVLITDVKHKQVMKKEVTIKEDMTAFYKNAGKELWIYNGLFRDKVLSLKKDKAIIMCETDAEYAVLIEDNQFIAVAKNMDYDYCCAFTLGNAEAYGDRMGISCSVCLLEDNENKAREMLKEAIIELSENSKIDCDGL